jgi:hypothetical protein
MVAEAVFNALHVGRMGVLPEHLKAKFASPPFNSKVLPAVANLAIPAREGDRKCHVMQTCPVEGRFAARQGHRRFTRRSQYQMG